MKFSSESAPFSTAYIEFVTDVSFANELVQPSPMIRCKVECFSQASRNVRFLTLGGVRSWKGV